MKFTNQLTPIALAILGLFTAPMAFSQQLAPQNIAQTQSIKATNSASSSSEVMDAIVVTGVQDKDNFNDTKNSIGKLAANPHDEAQSISIINKSLMQSQGATSLVDALRNVPGLTLGGAEGGQIGNNINLNGFSARTDIYLDGVRDRGQYYRDTFALDSVEVLMGPSSMLFGRGSTGGAINQVSKTPSLKSFTEVSSSITTNGLARATVDVNQKISPTSAFRIAAMGQDGSATTRDQTKVKDFGFAPSYKIGIGTPTEITFAALVQHNNDMPDYGVSPLNGHPAVNSNTAYGFTDDRTIQDIAALSANIAHKFSQTLSLNNKTQFNYVSTQARETAPNAIGTVGVGGFTATPNSTLPLDQLWVRQQSHDRDIRDSSLFNETEITSKFNTGSIKHTLLFGSEIGHDSYNNQGYYRNGSCNNVALNPVGGTSGYVACEPLINPTYTSSPGSVTSQTGNLATGSATTLAAFANDTLQLNPQFKFVGGLRYDYYTASISNSINSSNTAGNTTLGNASQTVNYLSVRTGGIWQPTDTQSYYVSYSTSFNPSLEQLTSTTGLSQPLPPETNRAYEVGNKWDLFDGNVSLNSALFQITQYNSRSQNADNTYTANGTIRVNGARTGISGKINNQWQVFAGYTYLDAKIVDAIAVGTAGKVPINTPKNSANLWTTYGFLPHWEAGGGMTYISQRYVNNTDTVQVGSYTRWDATVAYRQPKYDIRLNLFNLFNKKYYDQLIQSDGGRAVPGLGRTGMVTLTYRT